MSTTRTRTRAAGTTSNVPNLDAMDTDELRAFANVHASVIGNRAAAALALFPARPAGYVAATRDLGNYAWNALTARNARTMGLIDAALNYERICDTIYQQLPEWARW